MVSKPEAPFKLTAADAREELTKWLKYQDELITAYRRKRSWRPSEIAMCVAEVERRKEAIRMAINALFGATG